MGSGLTHMTPPTVPLKAALPPRASSPVTSTMEVYPYPILIFRLAICAGPLKSPCSGHAESLDGALSPGLHHWRDPKFIPFATEKTKGPPTYLPWGRKFLRSGRLGLDSAAPLENSTKPSVGRWRQDVAFRLQRSLPFSGLPPLLPVSTTRLDLPAIYQRCIAALGTKGASEAEFSARATAIRARLDADPSTVIS